VTLTVAPVTKQIVVDVGAQHAFDVFTAGIATWWPLATHHIGAADAETVLVEPRVGGRMVERGIDGAECVWGHLRAWEPPRRFVFSWEISADWQIDPTIGSEVEVRFVEETPTRTRVELEHRGLESFGERAQEMRESFDSDGGWNGLLRAYAEKAQASTH
jgi:uncharacterized protein YndB with AHSA1/START domain